MLLASPCAPLVNVAKSEVWTMIPSQASGLKE
jgi:hypothetical protein